MTRRTKVLTVIYTSLGVGMAIVSYFTISSASQNSRLGEVSEQGACRAQGASSPIWLRVDKRDAYPRGWLSDEEKELGNGLDQFDIFFCTDPQGRLQHIPSPRCSTRHFGSGCK